jgi:chromatin structure-remodeling complex subunit RSC1/2
MAITAAQKAAITEVLDAIVSAKSPRKKRVLSEMFLELVDRAEWPQYYEVMASDVRIQRKTHTRISR